MNEITTVDAYDIPHIADCLDSLAGKKYFNVTDLASAFTQLYIRESDKAKTAFSTREGLFEFNFVPQGMKNSPSYFARTIQNIMQPLVWKACTVFLDDIISWGASFSQALDNLRKVFQRIEYAGLTLKPKKCVLFQKQVSYLGYIVSEQGLSCDPSKIAAIQQAKRLQSPTGIRSFLGLCNFYRKFLRGFSKIAGPLFDLTKKDQPFVWTHECEQAWQQLKTALTSPPVMTLPRYDLINAGKSHLKLTTDASYDTLGGVLS